MSLLSFSFNIRKHIDSLFEDSLLEELLSFIATEKLCHLCQSHGWEKKGEQSLT